MKTTSLTDVSFTDLAQKLVNLLGGKALLGEGNNSVLVERKSVDGEKYYKLEIAKIFGKEAQEVLFSLEIEEGFVSPKRVLNNLRAKEMNNLYITLSEEDELENRRVSFLTVATDRYTVIEVDENFKTVVISNPGKGKKVEREKPREIKRKFIEL